MKAPVTIVQTHINAQCIIESMKKEIWKPARAYDPTTHKVYRPKSQLNSESFIIKNQSNSNYQSLWHQFKVAQAIIECYDKTDMVADTELSVMRYGMGDYIKPHNDLGIQKDRKGIKGSFEAAYTCLLYLNEIKGGELVLPNINEEIVPKAGTMVIFHASEQHAVNKVFSLERYAVLFRLNLIK